MPRQTGYRQPPPEATRPPITDSFRSPWIGKTVEECAKWLQAAAENSVVVRDYFTAINEFSKEDNTVSTCRVRIEDAGLKVDCYPISTEEIAIMMLTNRGTVFGERGAEYQRTMKRDGKIDRSQEGPFSCKFDVDRSSFLRNTYLQLQATPTSQHYNAEGVM